MLQETDVTSHTDLLDPLIDLAVRVGDDLTLVQGAGGNFSVKSGSTGWIKASGFRLRQAKSTSIFVPVDLDRARVRVLEADDVRDVVLPGLPGSDLRPSIEAALHVLLPQRYVLHVHSVGAIAAGVSDEGVARLRSVLPDVAVVPYARPGIRLAEALRTVGEPTGDVAIYLLRNHGLLVASDDLALAEAAIADVERATRSQPAAGLDDLRSWQRDALRSGAWTPDSAVFLGGSPFGVEDSESPWVLGDEGPPTARPSLSADAREIGWGIAVAASHLHPEDRVVPLPDDEVRDLNDWEAEKWRKAQEA